MFEQVSLRQWLRWTLVFLVIALATVYLNRNYGAERVIFENHHLDLAKHLVGVSEREVTTYPLWGYALLIALLGSGWSLQIFQAIVASATLAVFLLVARGAFPQQRRLLTGIGIAALPWYFMQSVQWPAAPAATLLLAAALALLRACETRRISWAALGGLLLGLSFNFRPDKLLLPVVLIVVWLAARLLARRTTNTEDTDRSAGLDPRALLVFAATSWALMLPWAIHYETETGRYALTSSNGGMVAFISLGQLSDNPWQIVHHDSHAAEVLETDGVKVLPWSETGHQLLLERFQESIRSHPAAYAQKIAGNLRSMLMAGFYLGDPQLSGDERVQLDVMREKLKLALGVNPNHYEIERYKEMGVWDELQPSTGTLALMIWQVIGTGLGALFLLIALVGMVGSPIRVASEPLLAICACVVVYQIALVGALQYSPRHMNAVFPFLIPFFVIAIERAGEFVRRARLVRR